MFFRRADTVYRLSVKHYFSFLFIKTTLMIGDKLTKIFFLNYF